MKTVNVYRNYFFEGDKLVCVGEVIKQTKTQTHVKMPIGDVYTFDNKTKKVVGNKQCLSITEVQ